MRGTGSQVARSYPGRPRPEKVGAPSRSRRTCHRSPTSETLARRRTTPPSRARAGGRSYSRDETPGILPHIDDPR
eukprot:5626379-Pyramimonas_sp.AAC.1